jgi:hypothetical protein
MNGRKFGSGSVFRLPSVSAARIAVSGRQKLKWYLLKNEATRLSSIAMLTRARARAFSDCLK